jgi:hypothetical protein
MRKEFTAISAFSTIIAFTAGSVLTMQISQLGLGATMSVTGPVMWAMEAAIFGTAVYLWRSRVSLPGWVMGIAALAGVRVALVSAAALTLALVRETADLGQCLAQTSGLVPRFCGVAFALMVGYPLRDFLPTRPLEHRRKGRGYAESAAVRTATAGSEGDNGLLIVTVKERGSQGKAQPEPVAPPTRAPGFLTSPVNGEVALPLATVLALMPEDLVTDKALALADTQTLSLPLDVIHPQLREAQVVFSVADVRELLPVAVRKALVQTTDSDLELESTLISLPLELIVPQLPEGALELPAPSPPKWAEAEMTDSIVFATIE